LSIYLEILGLTTLKRNMRILIRSSLLSSAAAPIISTQVVLTEAEKVDKEKTGHWCAYKTIYYSGTGGIGGIYPSGKEPKIPSPLQVACTEE
jgi:hypothetical protein